MDLLIGDPRNIPHPVKWIRKLVGSLDRKLLGEIPEDRRDPAARDKRSERNRGKILVFAVMAVTMLLTAAVLIAAYIIHPVAGVIAESILTCYLLSRTSMRRESMKVYSALKRGNLRIARKTLTTMARRDTDQLDEAGVTRATVETVAKNFSDGVSAPMIYAAIGGPVLGMAYKAIDTMDSMIGYRSDRYMWFGTAAARLDDLAKYIPSRLSALMMIAASAILGNDFDPGRAWSNWKLNGNRSKSPNAAQAVSACAGALGIRLGGGKGDELRPSEYEDIRRTNMLVTASSFICWSLCLVVLVIIV